MSDSLSRSGNEQQQDVKWAGQQRPSLILVSRQKYQTDHKCPEPGLHLMNPNDFHTKSLQLTVLNLENNYFLYGQTRFQI